MRKLLIMVLSLVLIFSLSACSGSSDSGNGGAKPANAPSENDSGTKTESPPAPQPVGLEQSWPTSTIYNVPEWEGITEYYGGGGSLDDYGGGSKEMNVSASVESFKAWLDALSSAGYEVSTIESPQSGTEHTAVMGPVCITVKKTEDLYQISFQLAKIGTWPSENLPDFITQIAGKTIVDTPVLYKPGDNLEGCSGVLVDDSGYNFQITYNGLTKEAVDGYMKDIASKLKDGAYSEGTFLDDGNGFCTIKGTYDWNGQNQYVYGEAAEADDGTFTFYFGWSSNEMGW